MRLIPYKKLTKEDKDNILQTMIKNNVFHTIHVHSISKKTLDLICQERFSPKQREIDEMKKQIDIYKNNLNN